LVRAGFTLEPKLVSLTPNQSSPGSTLVTAIVPGVGKGTTDLMLVWGESNNDLCRNG